MITLLGLTASGFFISSLYSFLKVAVVNQSLAAFYCGLVLLGISILFLLIFLIIKNHQSSEKKPSNNAHIHYDLLSYVKNNPTKSAMAIFVVGAIIGSSDTLRKKTIKLIRYSVEEWGDSPEAREVLADLLAFLVAKK